MKMHVVDTRELAYPTLTIRHDFVWLDVNERDRHVFSTEAWNFFAEHLEALISLDGRAAESHPNVMFGSNTKRHITNEDEYIGMSIYPGSYIDEWYVEFFEVWEDETGPTQTEIFKTHLRTASGKGSVHKKDELKALFQPVKPVR
jgi:hypothetical protein